MAKRKSSGNVVRFRRKPKRRKQRKTPRRRPPRTVFERLAGGLGLRLNAVAYGLLLLAGFLFQGDVKVAMADGDVFSGRVSYVVDGDTLHLSGAPAPIRLWGVDAPERDTPRGPAATEMLRRIAAGKRLDCETMVIDRYRRIVARCETADGADVSLLMISSGTAQEYFHYTGGYYARRRLIGR